jgi:hypothetical protein
LHYCWQLLLLATVAGMHLKPWRLLHNWLLLYCQDAAVTVSPVMPTSCCCCILCLLLVMMQVRLNLQRGVARGLLPVLRVEAILLSSC